MCQPNWGQTQLIDEGRVERGRGRGGSVRRIELPTATIDTPVPAEEAAESFKKAYESEIELYAPMCDVLKTDWARVRGSSPISVEITAQQGRRQTGGRWSRPDIIAVEVRTFQYVPGKFLTVTTYEIKPTDAIDVTAVYEALAHRRAATHSYVLLRSS
jgi:hypothetical protein